jgi:hypothetical protein
MVPGQAALPLPDGRVGCRRRSLLISFSTVATASRTIRQQFDPAKISWGEMLRLTWPLLAAGVAVFVVHGRALRQG